jgi:hypothetical protein
MMARQTASYHIHQMIHKCASRGFPCGTALTQNGLVKHILPQLRQPF